MVIMANISSGRQAHTVCHLYDMRPRIEEKILGPAGRRKLKKVDQGAEMSLVLLRGGHPLEAVMPKIFNWAAVAGDIQ